MSFTIMRNTAITIAFIALMFVLFALSTSHRGDFVVAMLVFAAAIWTDLRINRRGRYRNRSAYLLIVAFIAIVATAFLTTPAAYAAGIGVGA
ncbi:Uncharacterised protein [Mycobacteroides abscessus subsp. bolletii]|uniref:Uncharacterized protein n=1 Tax=Mycobacteroides abscessus subsp. bolletii TaxID=319705 RepID=A0A9Q7SES6_9MYCO|nr:hypothetical protein [Mycobacteroides abscessus]SHT84914.1 Uncharacterised protein [Mycobacteroides abscessus subsp. bolletii]SHU02705.1 Uncharacterised protein [Mycobacteroides abscessus subsp. bolletii]SHX42635.1 Uncharacterised protein [Mycobacteroides abscessus subsp. bolletii]SKM65414.1 Uncharacterised protein [Mycobacteroides abscessus subsp. bolletii]SKN39259.1 Uncharacterised protein [Mycobacteroides abscessus subsp. bolletii]